MTKLEQVQALLASKRYAVSDGGGVLRVKEVDSGVTAQAALEGDILYLSIVCATVPAAKITPAVMEKMLDAENGLSTSYFQLVKGEAGTTVTLNNFCKLQDMGADDEDDILSCLSFLLADVLHARDLIGKELS